MTNKVLPQKPSPPSREEAEHYYDDLPSRPILVARSSITPWEAPTGPDPDFKTLRPGGGPLRDVWDNLSLKVFDILNTMEVEWTSVDVVRIGYSEDYYAPTIIWIGVRPTTLSGERGVEVDWKCRELLYNMISMKLKSRSASQS